MVCKNSSSFRLSRRMVVASPSLMAILVAFASGDPGHAFEVDGFRSGMNVEEALAVAREYNPDAKPHSPVPGATWLVISTNKERESAKNWTMLFCHNQLVEMTMHYPFSWSAAAETVSRLNERYGEGTLSSVKSDWDFDPDRIAVPDLNGLPRSESQVGIRVFWENDVESASVFMELVISKMKEPSNAAREQREERISEMYALKNDRCSEEAYGKD